MNISPISLAFKRCRIEKRPALLTYTVAGDNSKKNSLEILIRVAEPMTPHLAEECWNFTGHKGSLTNVPWPQTDENLLIKEKK